MAEPNTVSLRQMEGRFCYVQLQSRDSCQAGPRGCGTQGRGYSELELRGAAHGWPAGRSARLHGFLGLACLNNFMAPVQGQ